MRRTEWPVVLLVLAVLLPTAYVLWLMNRAIRNERLALRQNVEDLYQAELAAVCNRLDADWAAKAASLESISGGAAGFARVVESGLADSAIVLDAQGAPVYPAPVRLPAADPTAALPEWARARAIEDTDLTAASAAYTALGDAAADRAIAARAFQAAARCLVQAGRKEAAAAFILQRFARSGLDRVADLQGRIIAGDALLMAVQILPLADARRIEAARRLRALLLDYDGPLTSAQRLFLMEEMRALKLPAALIEFPTLAAEELAARMLESELKPRADAALRLSALPGVWEFGSSKGRVVALFRADTVLAQTRTLLKLSGRTANVRAEVSAPGAPAGRDGVILGMPAGTRMPGWQASLVSSGRDPFNEVAGRQMALDLWIGSLVVGAVIVLALIAARAVSRSLRLAGLKTDLVAAVSHELKTPLSSMRLLVDTLLDEATLDPRKTREYLQLISGENARLSRLITNFLTFSRMERNRYSFEFAEARVEDVVHRAVEASGARFEAPDCHLEVAVAPGLPEIRADEDALVTALVNLLDNAYKYTPGEKRITLRAFAEGAGVCFEVRDNGIGIAPGEVKKIFRKFYQADRRLARVGGGCGLGLAIVRFLVEAHGGSVRVASEPGKGSTFTVALGEAA